MQLADKVVDDPFVTISPEFLQDPYSFYKVYREKSPVLWSESAQRWLIFPYSDVLFALRDPRIGKGSKLPQKKGLLSRLQSFLFGDNGGTDVTKWLLNHDPPQHTAFRKSVSHLFAPNHIHTFAPRIEKLVNELLDRAAKCGGCDWVADFATPIPFNVVMTLIGLPPDDFPQINSWVRTIAQVEVSATQDTLETSRRAMEDFARYLRPHLQQRGKDPKDDLLTALLRADIGGRILTPAEVVANSIFFTLAGYDSTACLIGNGLFALLRNPDQLQLLRDNPELYDSAVEEMLRYDAPVHLTDYVVDEEVRLRDQILRPGDRVLLVLGSANLDPEAFEEPDRFDIARKANKHLSFGGGSHYCLGANLARLEAKIAISTLLKRMPDVRLAKEDIRYKLPFRPRSLESLPITF